MTVLLSQMLGSGISANASSAPGKANSSASMQNCLPGAIEHCLQIRLTDNAIFLAEQLFAVAPNDTNAVLLARSLFDDRQYERAMHIVQGRQNQDAALLGAQCAAKLRRWKECALFVCPSGDMSNVNGGAAGLYLLGKAFRAQGNAHLSQQCLLNALKTNPLLFCAYEELCEQGANVQAADVMAEADEFGAEYGNQLQQTQIMAATAGGDADPSGKISRRLSLGETPQPQRSMMDRFASASSHGPPSAFVAATPSSNSGIPFTTTFNARMSAAATPSSPSLPLSMASNTPANPPAVVNQHAKAAIGSNINAAVGTGHASGSLFDSTPAAMSIAEAGTQSHGVVPASATGTTFGTGPPPMATLGSAGSAAPQPPAPKRAQAPRAPRRERLFDGGHSGGPSFSLQQDESFAEEDMQEGDGSVLRRPSDASGSGADSNIGVTLTSLLVGLGRALLHQHRCERKECLEALEQLPYAIRNAPYALVVAAVANFDAGKHSECVALLSRARLSDPRRLQGAAMLSTSMWFLRQEHDLAALGRECLQVDKMSPEAWCTVGNAFSLQRETDNALLCFNRAWQIDPTFSYATVLAGHEHVANDDLDNALKSFRSALKWHPRMYNAWFGLGQVYFKQERFSVALSHFLKAREVHPHSSVIACHLAMTYLELQHNKVASDLLQESVVADPANPLARLKYAIALARRGERPAALRELEAARKLSPRDPAVVFTHGKVLARLGRPTAALVELNHAMDLAKRGGSNVIKAAIDKLIQGVGPDDDTFDV